MEQSYLNSQNCFYELKRPKKDAPEMIQSREQSKVDLVSQPSAFQFDA